MPRSPRIPSYRRHSSGQARVTIRGKDVLLGKYGTPASREMYQRAVAEWLAKSQVADPGDKKLTVSELILAYWKFAAQQFGFNDRRRGHRGDYYCLRDALKVVRHLYGATPTEDFGPLALKACREKMILKDWSRSYINAQVDRIRRMFRWAAEEELLPGSVYQDLRAVSSLRSSQGKARETSRVQPVPQAAIDAALPFMPKVVSDMVLIQLLLGCRPDELCMMRPKDVDRTDAPCWIYRPGSDQGKHGVHKTAHHGRDRLILVGPKAQEILRPYLDIPNDAYCFSPMASEARRHALRRESRKSPMTPSQKKGSSGKSVLWG